MSDRRRHLYAAKGPGVWLPSYLVVFATSPQEARQLAIAALAQRGIIASETDDETARDHIAVTQVEATGAHILFDGDY